MQVLPSSVEAIRAATARGVRVCLATGKARPAAFRALTPVGLAGMYVHLCCALVTLTLQHADWCCCWCLLLQAVSTGHSCCACRPACQGPEPFPRMFCLSNGCCFCSLFCVLCHSVCSSTPMHHYLLLAVRSQAGRHRYSMQWDLAYTVCNGPHRLCFPLCV